MKRNRLIQTVFLLLLLILALGTEASYAESFTSAEDAAAYVRGQMKERAEEISVTLDCPLAEDPYGGDAEAAFQDLWERALAHTGVPDEGDYIYKALESWSRQTSEDAVDGGIRYAVRIWPVFRTTKAQEAAVTAAIDSAFASMTFGDKDDYGKIRVIHDWICDNVVYEYTRDVDPHTAYAAACNGAAVCQGYATLAYRALRQARKGDTWF
ncbi:MAG: hypothetical protein K5981_09030 [Clostridia bacterium]|nr:hypothetical protein [Clostridia bacterium]